MVKKIKIFTLSTNKKVTINIIFKIFIIKIHKFDIKYYLMME